jgi:hypothetical protein
MDEGASVSERRRRGGGVGGKPPRFEPIKESGAPVTAQNQSEA